MISLTVAGMGFEYIALLILAMLANIAMEKKNLSKKPCLLRKKKRGKKSEKQKYPRLKI